MGKGLAAIIDIGVGVVVEQYDGLCLAHLAQPVDDVFDLVLQHLLISGYVYLFPSLYIAQQLCAVHALSVAQRLAVFSDGSLQSTQVSLVKSEVSTSQPSNTFSPCQMASTHMAV